MGDSILSFLLSLTLSLVIGIPVLRLAERFSDKHINEQTIQLYQQVRADIRS